MIAVCVAEGCGVCRKSKNRVRLREKNVANWAWEEGMPYPLPYISIMPPSHISATTLFYLDLFPPRGEGGRGVGEVRSIRFGLSSLIHLFNKKFSASQPICPININTISTSLVDHISVA